jgi:hypothetical protein
MRLPRSPSLPSATVMVGSRGFEPRSARSERAASAVAPRADEIGPSGWTRTTTTRVKSPACCVDTTEGKRWSEWRDSNPHLKAWKARRRPLPHIRSGRTWTGIAHRPIDIRRLSKNPLQSSCGNGLATAPGFEPGPTSFGGSDAPVTPHCRSRVCGTTASTDTPFLRPGAGLPRVSGQNKKGLPGDRPRRPVSR